MEVSGEYFQEKSGDLNAGRQRGNLQKTMDLEFDATEFFFLFIVEIEASKFVRGWRRGAGPKKGGPAVLHSGETHSH